MSQATAHPGESVGDVTYVRTDPDLPPVAIIDRSPITTRHRVIFGVIAVVAAVAWAVIAFARGETVNAVWFVIAAIGHRRAAMLGGILIAAGFFLASFIPFVGFLALNLATMAATRLFLEHMKEQAEEQGSLP